MIYVRVTISRFVDESFPGFVECLLDDAHGRTWKFIVKVLIATAEDLGPESRYPKQGSFECAILRRRSDTSGRRVLTINTGEESTDGTTVFEVFADQIEDENAVE